MADLTTEGRRRTDLALRQLALMEHQPTGQLPARRRMPSVFMASLVSLLSAAPAPKPRRAGRVVHAAQLERCGFCQNRWVQAVAVICLAWFAAVGIVDTMQRNQDVQAYDLP